jgi:predicted XRE-type DNA-binding protein
MKKTAARIDKKEDNVITRGSGNIFIDCGFEPAEARIMLMHEDLMISIKAYLRSQEWTQSEMAKRLAITQPRVSKLMRGRSKDFSLDMLLLFAERLGMKPELRLGAEQSDLLAA